MKGILIVAAMLLAGVVNAQTDIQKKKADFYATEAVAYFKLDSTLKKGISEAKADLMVAQKEMERKKKEGEIPESELDAYRKANVYPFTKKILDLINVTFKELNVFNEIVNPKMNLIK
ncbi:MAG: hypothetical protein EAY75_08620 [Bacteroidetes bacterium]|nr:MAG: hypothetical protein EAY75_08620 [Bacteroidota bacterium]